MSGSVIRARQWLNDGEDQYLTVSPNGETVSLYQTNNQAVNEEDNIVKIVEKAGFESIQCINHSYATPGLTAVGQLDGKCLIFDMRNTLNEPLVLKPLQPRSCNAVSFNENGLVAMGYDRGRQDNSIHVWDINSFNKGNYGNKTNKVFSCINNESISSLTFCPSEPTNFISGSYKLLREYDIRSNQPLYQIASRCTLNITVNPFTPFMFASNSEDGSLAIWDRRKLSESFKLNSQTTSTAVLNEGPVLLFNKLLSDYQKRTNGSPFRFSSVHSGEISALFDGDLVRRWKVDNVPPLEEELTQYDRMVKQNKKENASFVPKIPRPTGSMFISKVHDTKTKYERVISFDYAPSKDLKYGVDLVCMRQSGSIYKMKVIDSQNSITFNSYNDVAFCGPEGVCTKYVKDEDTDRKILPNLGRDKLGDKFSGLAISKTMAEDEDGEDERDDLNEQLNNEADTSREENKTEVDVFMGGPDSMCLASDSLLENDICSTIRRRATKGYGTDASLNMEILDSMNTYETQLHLKNAWKWIDISNGLISAGKMTYRDFDFGYLGVWGIWNMNKDFMILNRYSGFENVTEKDVTNAARSIVERRTKECNILAKPVIGFQGKSTKEVQRHLAMYVIGWDFGVRELEEKYTSLIANGNYERAAGWAIFHGDVNRAITILGDSNNENYKIMSTAIAAYAAFKDSNTNNSWKDRCRQLASDLADPYLRIIFAYIADGNWWDVLDETALPLRERLGVALRFLSDSELEIYLNSLADSVIERGDVEGIILTGITMKGINLLQSFIDRDNDIQTACLIASFASPKYFVDERVEKWVHSYRTLLNSWSLFSARAKFDISRTKLSRKNSESHHKFVPRQLYLQCVNCHRHIIKDEDGDMNGVKKSNNHSCQSCGYPLPRCAICLITQGVPVPKEVMYMKTAQINDKGYRDIHQTGETTVTNWNESKFKEWFSFCLSCNHCMHAGHAEEWFSKHYVCPVPDCECKCNNR